MSCNADKGAKMIFDKLCGIAERHIPSIRKVLHEARVFLFPGRAHEILKQEKMTDETMYFLQESFFLPFPFIAVEDSVSCVLIWDNEAGQVGLLNKTRFFVECMALGTNAEEFPDKLTPENTQELAALRAQLPPETYSITAGRIVSYQYRPSGEKKLAVFGDIAWNMLATKLQVVSPPRQISGGLGMDSALLRNGVAALEEVMFFNTPDRFVVEKSPLKQKEPRNERRILRSDKRPVYTVLRPHEIRTTMHLPSMPNGTHKSPHERRRHYRTFRSDFFKEKKGQTITIPACFIGPTEAIVGNHRYKVLVDL